MRNDTISNGESMEKWSMSVRCVKYPRYTEAMKEWSIMSVNTYWGSLVYECEVREVSTLHRSNEGMVNNECKHILGISCL